MKKEMKKISVWILIFAMCLYPVAGANMYNYVYNGSSWVPALSTADGQQKYWINMANASYGEVQYNMTINERLGIGTSNPSHELNIIGDANITGDLYLNSSSIYLGDKKISFEDGAFSFTDDFAINTSNFYVNVTSGNVGIGTSSPGYDLEIYDDSGSAELLLNASGATNIAGYYRIKGDRPSEGNAVGGILVNNMGATDIGQIVFERGTSDTKGDIRFYTSNSEQMVIDEDGNVGIGTSSPDEKLHVVGDVLINKSSNNPTLRIDALTTQFPILRYSHEETTAWDIGSDASGADSGLYFYDTDSASRVMTIKNGTGNVGIGTTSPDYQLELSTDSAGKPSTNTWTISSDKRIKTNISDFKDGLSTIEKINPVTYNYNGLGGDGYNDNETHIGIIAQDLEEVAPYMVETRNGKIGNETVDDFKSYQGHALPFILVNAIKELIGLNNEQDDRISELEEENKMMKQTLCEMGRSEWC